MNENKKYLGLSGEFKRFNKLLRPLRRLNRDTFHSLEDVILCEDLTKEHVKSLSCSDVEKEELQDRLYHPLSIVIAGQDNYGKVAVLTKLLGMRLLPFSGFQHTCDSEFLQPPLEQSFSFPTTIDPSIESGNVSAYPKNTYATSQKKSTSVLETCERPWRGVKIAYSSQLTYSVVRPDCQGIVDCKCEAETVVRGKLKKGREELPKCDTVTPLLKANEKLADESPRTSVVGPTEKCGPILVDINGELKANLAVEEQKKQALNYGNSVNQIPISELELGPIHLKDAVLRDALLDVGLNHCLLREQVHIVITPSINKYPEQWNQPSRPANTLLHEFTASTLLSNNNVEDNEDSVSSASEASCTMFDDDNLHKCSLNVEQNVKGLNNQAHSSENMSDEAQAPIVDQESLKVGLTACCSSLLLSSGSPLSENNVVKDDARSFGTLVDSDDSFKSFKSLPDSENLCATSKSPNLEPVKLTRSFSLQSPRVLKKKHSSLVFYTVHPPTPTDDHFDCAIEDISPCSEQENCDSLKSDNVICNKDVSLDFFSTPNMSPANSPEVLGDKGLLVSSDSEKEIADSPFNDESKGFIGTLLPGITAVVVYAITRNELSDQNIAELQEIRDHSPVCPILFVRVPPFLHKLLETPLAMQVQLLTDYGILPSACSTQDHHKSVVASSTSLSLENQEINSCVSGEVISDDATQILCNEKSRGTVLFDREGNNKEYCKKELACEQVVSEELGLNLDVQRDPLLSSLEAPESKRPKNKIVKFNQNEEQEACIKLNEITSKSLKSSVITSGNCLSSYAEDQLEQITKKSALLFKTMKKSGLDIFDEGNIIESSNIRKSVENMRTCLKTYKNEHQQYKELCKMPEEIMHFLRDELGFFSSPSHRTPLSYVAHCHVPEEVLDMNEHAKNPFVNAFSRTSLIPQTADCSSQSGVEMLALSTTSSDSINQESLRNNNKHCSELCLECEIVESFAEFDQCFLQWIKLFLRSNLAYTSQLLNKVQSRCLSSFVVFAFDFCRRQQITPRRLAYARQQEEALFNALLNTARYREDNIRKLICHTLQHDKELLLEEAERFRLPGFISPESISESFECSEDCTNSGVDQSTAVAALQAVDIREAHYIGNSLGSYGTSVAWCETAIQHFIAVPLQEEMLGVLRVSKNLILTSGNTVFVKECVLRAINRRVGAQLVADVRQLRETCLGTLQRCLSQLEEDCQKSGELPSVTNALRKLVNAAYQVEARPTSSWGLLRGVWERVKELLRGGGGQGRFDIVVGSRAWKRQVALDMIGGLSEKRLARSIANQVSWEINSAHAMFLSNLSLLEKELQYSLASNERRHHQLKTVHAPRLARLALHTEAINNRVKYGLPELSHELGRGHFGVVYSCPRWGPFAPCAVKTLLPRDPAQWRDIAMQYHYTRLMGYHPRIVTIHACLIDKYYGEHSRSKSSGVGGGSSHKSWRGYGGPGVSSGVQCVLLVMDVHKCDLDAAIRRGLMWYQRFRIALDVVQGLRFLHSQGLVHRDIKAKNVLIDEHGRASITDLDFCKPEAMITGSVVGTPIHMAPELFYGNYDFCVDVYAFGVLFWYICSGKTNMPKNFGLQKSKEELKNAVFKGLRPEQLNSFTPECWDLMEKCWAPDPKDRILLGTVETRLQRMLDNCLESMRDQTSNSAYFLTTAQGEKDSEDEDNQDPYSSSSDDNDSAE